MGRAAASPHHHGAPPARGTRCCTPWGRAMGHPAGHRVLPARVFHLLPTCRTAVPVVRNVFLWFHFPPSLRFTSGPCLLVPAPFHLPKFCDSLPGPFPHFSHVSKASPSECCSLGLLPVFSSPSANCQLSFPRFNNQPLRGCCHLPSPFVPLPLPSPERTSPCSMPGVGSISCRQLFALPPCDFSDHLAAYILIRRKECRGQLNCHERSMHQCS